MDLLADARRAGVHYWPGEPVLCQGKRGTVTRVHVDTTLDLAGDAPMSLQGQRTTHIAYWVALDSGEHLGQVPGEQLISLKEGKQ